MYNVFHTVIIMLCVNFPLPKHPIMFSLGEDAKKLYMIWSGRAGKYPLTFL